MRRNLKPRSSLLLPLLLIIPVIIFGCNPQSDPEAIEPTLVDGVSLRKIGYGDRGISLLNAFLLDPESGVNATVLQTSHDGAFMPDRASEGRGTVVRFQPATGNTQYLDLPGGNGAWAGAKRDDLVILGSHQIGNLYQTDLQADALTRIPIPKPGGEKFEFVWSVDFGSDGKVYVGTYPEGALVRYDPESGQFENLGQMVESEKPENYLRHVNGKFPGKIYCGIGTPAELVVYEIETGRKSRVLPEKYKSHSFMYYSDRFRDMLVAVATPNPIMLFIDPATHEVLREVHPPDGSNAFWNHSWRSFITWNDALYFGTAPNDNLYRYDYDEDTVTLVAEGIGRPFDLAQNRYLFCRDFFDTYNIFDLQENRIVRSTPSRFQGKGMHIYSLATAPGNRVLGGAYINQAYFEYDANTDQLKSMGKTVTFGGQIDEIVAANSKIYLAHYTKTRLTEYDPAQPWQPGMAADANPRYLGNVGHEQDRFSGAWASEDGTIYFGTTPNYGQLGGALVEFDPDSEQFDVFRHVVKDQAVYALDGNNSGVLAGATSVRGGYGADPTASSAALFFWDTHGKKKVRERVIVEGSYEMWNVAWLDSDRVIGSADSTLFVYDFAADTTVATRQVAPSRVIALLPSTDGWCYGTTESMLFRISKDLRNLEVIDRRTGYWRGLVETDGGRVFVGIGAVLHEVVRR